MYQDSSFDILIDKSTIDALLCGDDSFLKTAKMLKEAQRVLKVGGVYLAISYGNPESREFHFYREFLSFNLKTYSLSETDATTEDKEEKTHYVYVCVKNADADDICA
jgi:ubiquinone/menaquinone biosynthesis C-methylase UbiE